LGMLADMGFIPWGARTVLGLPRLAWAVLMSLIREDGGRRVPFTRLGGVISRM